MNITTGMKKIYQWSMLAALLVAASQSQAYTITIKINGAKNQRFLLGYYYGDKQFIRDSAMSDASGKMVFKGKDKLDGGVYLLASADKRLLFDFIVTEQEFSLETDTNDFIPNMKVKGSVENEVFFNYSKYSTTRGMAANEAERKYRAAKEKNDTADMRKYREELRKYDREVNDYRKQVMLNHPQTLISKIFRMMQEIDVPEPPQLPNGARDSLWGYYYYRQAYLNNFDFTDDRLSRTPVFHSRIENYITKIIPQIPDSIAVAAFDVCDRAQKSPEMSKWLIYWITNYYETSKYMGMDKVFVMMVDRYYSKKEITPWVDEVTRVKITARADQLRYNLIGVKPLNLNLPDTAMRYQALFSVKADYTVLVFWDPHCSHCKEELPKLLKYYNEANKGSVKTGKKIEIYALGSTSDYPEWKKYIFENKLPWINVHDPYKESNYHRYYDIYSTPVIYLLNRDKKIIGKRLSADQVIEFIDKGIE
jgi:thiol-disulfide isomerase/thioredoxin